MPQQTGLGGCVYATLTELKVALCGTGGQKKNDIEGAIFLYAQQQYGQMAVHNGIDAQFMPTFTDHFLDVDYYQIGGSNSGVNYQAMIEAGHPIIVDKPSYMASPISSIHHCVTITGYIPNNSAYVYVLDPETGTTGVEPAGPLLANTTVFIEVVGCK